MTRPIFVEGNLASSTRRNRLRWWLARRLRRDGTTGLRAASAYTSTARRRGAAVVVFLDVDGMKALNDRWGIPGGESVLRALGAAVKVAGARSARAFRTGGDQATLVFGPADVEEAAQAADRVRAAFADARFMTDYMKEPHGDFALSAGVASSPTSIKEAAERAEAAVRAAKAAGGNRVVVWRDDQALAPE